MMKLLLPVLLLLLGIGGGVGAGILLAPATDSEAEAETGAEDSAEEDAEATDDAPEKKDDTPTDDHSDTSSAKDGDAVEYLNMSNQFVIPLVNDGLVNGLVVVTISLEVVEGTIAAVNLREPKIRDQFLQVLFNHANNGGFDGNFTDFRYVQSLKDELLRNARVVAGQDVTDVLILDLVRQDP